MTNVRPGEPPSPGVSQGLDGTARGMAHAHLASSQDLAYGEIYSRLRVITFYNCTWNCTIRSGHRHHHATAIDGRAKMSSATPRSDMMRGDGGVWPSSLAGVGCLINTTDQGQPHLGALSSVGPHIETRPTMPAYQTFGIWGAGNLGGRIAENLLERKASVIILTRPVSVDPVRIYHERSLCSCRSLLRARSTRRSLPRAPRSGHTTSPPSPVLSLGSMELMFSSPPRASLRLACSQSSWRTHQPLALNSSCPPSSEIRPTAVQSRSTSSKLAYARRRRSWVCRP
jgi:hypothetical protein